MACIMFRTLILFLLALTAYSAEGVDHEHTAINEQHVGWLHGNCLAIKNSLIPAQTPITVVLLDVPQSVIKGEIIAKASSDVQCYPLLADRRQINIANGYSFYLITTQAPVNLGIGLLGQFANANNYRFDYCTTSEGVSFTVSQNGIQRWRGYYYLGSDTEATCKPEQ